MKFVGVWEMTVRLTSVRPSKHCCRIDAPKLMPSRFDRDIAVPARVRARFGRVPSVQRVDNSRPLVPIYSFRINPRGDGKIWYSCKVSGLLNDNFNDGIKILFRGEERAIRDFECIRAIGFRDLEDLERFDQDPSLSSVETRFYENVSYNK